MTDTTRRMVGKYSSLAAREAIYEADDGFDVETRAGYEVVERRVLYDDVLFVTYHRHYGAAYLITTGLISLFFLGLALITWSTTNEWAAAVPVGVLALPSTISFLLRVFFGVDMITIFGRRSKASIGFRVRKKRARAAYGRICARVRAAQNAGQSQRAETPESAPEDGADHGAGTLPV